MKILGINISHNPSVSFCKDGTVISYYDETRFIKNKSYCPTLSSDQKLFYKSIDQKISDDIDHVIFSSFGCMDYEVQLNFNLTSIEYERKLSYKVHDLVTIKKFEEQITRKFPNVKQPHYYNEHHLYHAVCGFEFSNFDEAICIVMDGGGATLFPEEMPTYQEMESVYFVSKKSIKPLYKHLSNARYPHIQYLIPTMKEKSSHEKIDGECRYLFTSDKSSGYLFADLTGYLQLYDDASDSGSASGKTMGLSAYGNSTGTRKEDLAKQLQIKTEKHTIELIDYAAKLSHCKNIILSGGYALNCLNNYKYVQAFPHLNFFVDPVAHDGGTSIGASLWLNRKINGYA